MKTEERTEERKEFGEWCKGNTSYKKSKGREKLR